MPLGDHNAWSLTKRLELGFPIMGLDQGRCISITWDNLSKYRLCGSLEDYKLRKFIRPLFTISGKELYSSNKHKLGEQ